MRSQESAAKKAKENTTTSTYNKLNELTGKEWIKFTRSWFIHRPKPRTEKKILHPASFPESLIKEFILFFTKKGQLIIDPFLGTGSTLIACLEVERDGIGVEIVPKYAKNADERIDKILSQKRGRKLLTGERVPFTKVLCDNSKHLSEIWLKKGFRSADYCVTSPPYWNQLKRDYMRQKGRKKRNLDTSYSDNPEEIGTIDGYNDFLIEMKKVFNEVYKVMKVGGYLTVITNNIFFEGRIYPLAFDTVQILSEKPYAWCPKDEKIWCQEDKPLLPLGVNNAWVGNRHHQYCLIFRKEKK